jgi:hypothetical protein
MPDRLTDDQFFDRQPGRSAGNPSFGGNSSPDPAIVESVALENP